VADRVTFAYATADKTKPRRIEALVVVTPKGLSLIHMHGSGLGSSAGKVASQNAPAACRLQSRFASPSDADTP